ncbi:HAD family hydrolase [Novibacillus thermophilus]|uniref:Phosphatase n=1 Tax=Novibacillus thermophilus TaxID=1471761 RepID=A0A1U9K500_9BACL|nr:HAD family hydrolase [Novibacillus thermophilus]AQS55127.1 phosphatase [Novibacillus thermophilus]
MITTILFDVDGVFLSEERCFDASALSVWELLHSSDYLGLSGERFSTALEERDIRRIRKLVFAHDDTLNFVKNRGINSNWDMVFMTTAHQLLHLLQKLMPTHEETVRKLLHQGIGREELQQIGHIVREEGISFAPDYTLFVPDFSSTKAEKQAVIRHLNVLAEEWFGVKTEMFSRDHPLWELGRTVYQEWYLGDAYFEQSEGSRPQTPGKKGFLENEIPLAEPDEIRALLRDLRSRGIRLGIGTGRPRLETDVPFQVFGFSEYFHPKHVATASEVLKAEDAFPEKSPLGKPQPYTYMKALLGTEVPDRRVIETPLPLENGKEVLIVGDSVADYMAAQSMGCRFAATLTGLSGKEARSKFEHLQADYICDDVLQLRHVLL